MLDPPPKYPYPTVTLPVPPNNSASSLPMATSATAGSQSVKSLSRVERNEGEGVTDGEGDGGEGSLDVQGAEDRSSWFARWREGRTTFHRPEPNEWLVRHAKHILVTILGGEDRAWVLVPLAGKSVDMW